MINDEKYYCVTELGAEILMVIISSIMAISVAFLLVSEDKIMKTLGYLQGDLQEVNLFLSLAYTLFLPLMSYLYSQAKRYNSDGRAQVILIWMVLIEIIRMRCDPIFTWRLRKSAEQMVRFFWVGFLVCSYTPLPGIRVSLLILCIYFGVSEVLKGIMFHKAKDSYLIGKNPKIIHNYVERIMFQNDLHTTPMDICDYIVMGDENHEIDICGNGYILGKKKSNSKGIITIRRVFQLNSSEDEAFTLAHPYWRDVCLSFALAKMLRRRFAKLLEDEAECRKSLNFVLEGIIDYIGKNRDIQTNRNDGERNPTRRVFTIIQQELEYVSEFLHLRVPISHYFEDYTMVDLASIPVMFGNGVYLIYTISKRSSAWLSLLVEKAYTHCLFNGFRRGSMVVKIFSRLDLAITILLVFACIYIQYTGSSFVLNSPRWSSLKLVERYIKDPTKWNRSHNSLVASKSYKLHSQLLNRMVVVVQRAFIKKVRETRVHHSSIVDLETETIFFCIKVDGSILACLPKWARRIIPTSSPTIICSIDAKEAILKEVLEKKWWWTHQWRNFTKKPSHGPFELGLPASCSYHRDHSCLAHRHNPLSPK